jgi:hypothetical protein
MAWTQAQADALRVAIAAGVKSVSVNGRTVTYASIAEMMGVLRAIEAEANAPTQAVRPVARKLRFREPS